MNCAHMSTSAPAVADCSIGAAVAAVPGTARALMFIKVTTKTT